MSRPPDPPLDVAGPAAPPRRNGELCFAAPWEGRLFGLTLALHRAGVFAWDDFRGRLIAEIGAWERRHGAGVEYRYYERWLAALEAVLVAAGVCVPAALDARVQALAARPPGHDHGPLRVA